MFDPEDDPMYDLMARYDYYREAYGDGVDPYAYADEIGPDGQPLPAPEPVAAPAPAPAVDWADDDIPF